MSRREPTTLPFPAATQLQQRWSAAYLRMSHPDTLVDVSVTRDDEDGYLRGTADTHETIEMKFGSQFLAQLDDSTECATWQRRPSALRYHLAQCPLHLLPALQADTEEALGAAARAACSELGLDAVVQQTNLWFAIGATVSGLHYDCFDNLLIVVRGRKRVLLMPPSASGCLRPRPAHAASANHSQLSAAELRSVQQPAPLHLEVRAGEALFIPEGWWHQVESPDEATLALNLWSDGPLARLMPPTPRTPPPPPPLPPPLPLPLPPSPPRPPSTDAAASSPHGCAAYVLRRAFEESVREEERAMIAALQQQQQQAPMQPGGVAAADTADESEGVASELAGVASELVGAAGRGQSSLLRCLATRRPEEVLRGMAEAARASPQQLRRLLLRAAATPATAHVLCSHFDAALGAAGNGAAAHAAAAQLDAVFGANDDDADGEAGGDAAGGERQALARQAALFGEVAARRVVHRVLGLAHEPPPSSLASLLMTPEEVAAAATETETDPAHALLPLATKRPTAAADDEGVARTRRRT